MPTGTGAPTANYSPLVDEVTTQRYVRNTWDLTKKIRLLLEKMEMAGNIKTDGSGKYIEWKALVGEFQTARRADLAARSFSRKQHYITYTAPWSFMEVTGVLSDRDLQLNRGKEALVKLTADMLTRMGTDFKKQVNQDILRINRGANTVLGAAAYTGIEEPINGLPTMFGAGASILGYNFATQASTGGAVAATDKEALPNTTYFGQSTLPGGLIGVDNPIAEANSPVLANWSHTGWENGGGAATWNANCLDVLDHLILRLTRSADNDETPDLGLCSLNLYRGLQAKVQSKLSITMDMDTPRSPNAGMYPRRFIPYKGLEISYDEDALANVFYCLNTKQLEFHVLPQSPVGGSEGAIEGSAPEMCAVTQQHSIEQGGHLVVAQSGFQLVGKPRYQGVAFNFA